MMLILFHLSVISLYSYTIYYDQMFVDIKYPTKEYEYIPMKARAIFFTFWTLVLQTVYFIVALLNDIIGTNAVTKKPPLIRKLKDVLFSITLTTAFYVVIMFWLFYTIDKTMLFPNEEAEKIFPKWLNHVMHTLILPIILIELFATKRNYPTKKTGFSVAIYLTVIYAAYIHYIYFMYGIWPYPFLYVVSWTTKIIHFVGSGIFGMIFYLLGEKLDRMTIENSKPVSYANGNSKKHH